MIADNCSTDLILTLSIIGDFIGGFTYRAILEVLGVKK
jgi:hypothetical protein